MVVPPLECRHCRHIMFLSKRTDRASGEEAMIYKCTFCGLEYTEPRPNSQIKRD